VAADPGPGDRAARPGAAGSPAEAQTRPRLQPAAGVSPAAAAAAVEAAKAAEAAGAATTQRHKAAAQRLEAAGASRASSGAQGGIPDHDGSATAAADSAAGADFATGELSEEQRDVLATIVREALASEVPLVFWRCGELGGVIGVVAEICSIPAMRRQVWSSWQAPQLGLLCRMHCNNHAREPIGLRELHQAGSWCAAGLRGEGQRCVAAPLVARSLTAEHV
jgi:hypothetical protein